MNICYIFLYYVIYFKIPFMYVYMCINICLYFMHLGVCMGNAWEQLSHTEPHIQVGYFLAEWEV